MGWGGGGVFPAGPLVNNLPVDTGDEGSVPGPGKINLFLESLYIK